MNNLSSPLYITGLDPETNKFLLGGIFKMQDEVGFPVDSSIDEANDRGYLIDWLEALCDCWLNDCMKYDSFVRHIKYRVNEDIDRKFKETSAVILSKFPEMKDNINPVNAVCEYILDKKKKGLKLI